MRPAILIPLKTRDGVADAPIEPGLRMLCEPCDRGPELKLWRLIVPWKPLPIPVPETLILSPGSNRPTVTVSPSTAPSIPPRNSTSRRCAPTPNRFRWPSSGRLSFRSGTASKATWTAGHGPAAITVTGVTPPLSASKTCVIPSFVPRIPFAIRPCSRGQKGFVREADRWRGSGGTGRFPQQSSATSCWPSQLDLDVDSRRQIEPHQLVDRLRVRAVDVDEALVRAHLEVLARVLVLERAADHAVDVLLGRKGDRPSDRRARALRGLDDRLGRPVQLLVVVPLEADPDLPLCHVSRFSLAT